MKIKTSSYAPVLAMLACLAGSPAWGGSAVLLTDAELDAVHGGALLDEEPTPINTLTINVETAQNISGLAQQGASAWILVNAVNAPSPPR